jgi:capsular polysaccharide export protein
LVVKVHPLDNGLTDWAGALTARSGRLPVVFLDGGELQDLLSRACGVVTINSTVGLSAILAGRATCVLGKAMYDLLELTHAQKLDTFWECPKPPNPSVAKHFAEYLRATWHVSGAFDGPGSKAGAQALADWLSDPPF